MFDDVGQMFQYLGECLKEEDSQLVRVVEKGCLEVLVPFKSWVRTFRLETVEKEIDRFGLLLKDNE